MHEDSITEATEAGRERGMGGVIDRLQDVRKNPRDGDIFWILRPAPFRNG